jgi:glycosyltransferase involved in cell wall biosynthesis
MKIGIISDSVDHQQTGIAVYTYNLIKNLQKIDKKNQYYLIHCNIHAGMNVDFYKENREILITTLWPFKDGSIWRTTMLPLKLRTLTLDLVHDTFGIGPFYWNMPFKKVITIHDLTPLLLKNTYRTFYVLWHKMLYPKTVRNVDRIITCSACSFRDIVKYLHVPPEKITIISNGVDERFKPLNEEQKIEVKKKYGINAPYILSVGIDPRKNILNLLKAYYLLKKKGIGYKLVIVGAYAKVARNMHLFQVVERLNLQKDVIITGYVPDNDLPKLYGAANLFVYPSLYEGFGIPPLEAMACGVPVIASNTSSLPEVIGDAGIMVNPYNVEELAKKMYEVLNDQVLREFLIKKGLIRSKMFSWENCAKETLRVYEEVCGKDFS